MTTSYRYSGIKRRDARNSRDEVRRPSGSKRDTKKWCRGVIGREHDPEWKSYADLKNTSRFFEHWSVLVCRKCGKELKIDYGKVPFWRKLQDAKKEEIKAKENR